MTIVGIKALHGRGGLVHHIGPEVDRKGRPYYTRAWGTDLSFNLGYSSSNAKLSNLSVRQFSITVCTVASDIPFCNSACISSVTFTLTP